MTKATFSYEVIHASMLRKWVAIGCAVVLQIRDTHAFSAGFKCSHCIFVWLPKPRISRLTVSETEHSSTAFIKPLGCIIT